MKKIIITGASGMLGLSLIKACAGSGVHVTAVVRPDSARRRFLTESADLKVIECPLERTRSLDKLLPRGADALFHLAWEGTDKDSRKDPAVQAQNIGYTLEMAGIAKQTGCAVFVGAGSQAEYGRSMEPLREDMPVSPETAYGCAKYAAGRLSALWCEREGLKHVWTRIFSVYGPNDGKDTMIMYCIDSFLHDKAPLLTKCGQMWDYLYCSDAARALLLAAEKGKNGTVYNIGGGTARPLIEYVKTIKEEMKTGIEAGIGRIEYGPGQIMHLCADTSLLKRDTGFEAGVDFKTGIRETIKWARESTE